MIGVGEGDAAIAEAVANEECRAVAESEGDVFAETVADSRKDCCGCSLG